MGYMVQGGGSSTMSQPRTWLFKYPNESHTLLRMITDVVVDYLVMQAKAGAQALQIFESNGDYLEDELFEEFSFQYMKQISEKVKAKLEKLNIPKPPMVNSKLLTDRKLMAIFLRILVFLIDSVSQGCDHEIAGNVGQVSEL